MSGSTVARSKLYAALLELNGKYNAARLGGVQSALPQTRSDDVGRRLICPGQLLRFPTQGAWEEFRDNKFLADDTYDIIQYTDPLGFDGGVGRVYKDASENPRNFLRREQLPPMQIDMVNIYNPSITGGFPKTYNENFTPFLGARDGMVFPEMLSSINTDKLEFVTMKSEEYTGVATSFVPRLYTYEEAMKYFFWFSENAPSNIPVINSATITTVTHQVGPGNGQGLLYTQVLTPSSASTPIAQTSDCSKPNVGCFWFNDGKEKIELPKDPRCRACPIVRFKKYVVI